jgi:hypothetical protein
VGLSLRTLALHLLLGIPLLAGCAGPALTRSELVYAGRWDERADLQLWQEWSASLWRSGGEYNFVELTLLYVPYTGEPRLVTYVRREAADWLGVKPWRFHELRGRRDEAGERFWLLERTPLNETRVVFSWDAPRAVTGGPADSTPSWATEEGGQALRDLPIDFWRPAVRPRAEP